MCQKHKKKERCKWNIIYTHLINKPRNSNIVWAVCVYKGSIKTVPVGYIPKELAAELAPVMDKGAKLYCNTAHITGGTNKYMCGLNIAVTPYMPANR